MDFESPLTAPLDEIASLGPAAAPRSASANRKPSVAEGPAGTVNEFATSVIPIFPSGMYSPDLDGDSEAEAEKMPSAPEGLPANRSISLTETEARLRREVFRHGFPGHLANDRYLVQWERDAEGFPESPAVFSRPRLHVEVGCGKALGLCAQALNRPDTFFLGVERCAERFRAAERRAAQTGAGNLRVVRRDAIPLIAFNFPDQSVDRLEFLYPDPWPKPGHARRRWHLHPFVMTVRRVLKPGGQVLVASDRESFILEAAVVYALLGFTVECCGPVDPASRRSHFEVKYLARGMPLFEALLSQPAPL